MRWGTAEGHDHPGEVVVVFLKWVEHHGAGSFAAMDRWAGALWESSSRYRRVVIVYRPRSKLSIGKPVKGG